MRIRADAVRTGTDLGNGVGAISVVEHAYVHVPYLKDDPSKTIALVLKDDKGDSDVHFYAPDQLLDLGPASTAHWAAIINGEE